MIFTLEFVYVFIGIIAGWLLTVFWDLYNRLVELKIYKEVVKDLFLGYFESIYSLLYNTYEDLKIILNEEFIGGLLYEIVDINYLYLYLPKMVPIIEKEKTKNLLKYFNRFSFGILSINKFISDRNYMIKSALYISSDLLEEVARYDMEIIDWIRHIIELTEEKENFILKNLGIKKEEKIFYKNIKNNIKNILSSSVIPLDFDKFMIEFDKKRGLL